MLPVQLRSPYLVNVEPTVRTVNIPQRISLDIINFLRPLNEQEQLLQSQMDPLHRQHWFFDDDSQSLTYLSLVLMALVILAFSFLLGFLIVYIRRKDEEVQADLEAEKDEQPPPYADERLPTYSDLEVGLSELDGDAITACEKC